MATPCWMVLDTAHADFLDARNDCAARLNHYFPRNTLSDPRNNAGSKALVKSVDPAFLSTRPWIGGGVVLATFETASDAKAEFDKAEWSIARTGS